MLKFKTSQKIFQMGKEREKFGRREEREEGFNQIWP